MKNIYKIALFAATAAFAFAGCNKTDELDIDNTPETGKSVSVRFLADFVDNTRATLDVGESTFTGKWEHGDAMGVHVATPENGGAYHNTIVKATYNIDSKAFGAHLPSETAGSWKYRAYAPHLDGMNGPAVEIPFGNLRTQRGNNFNMAFDALVADEISVTNGAPGKDEDGNDIKFDFTRLSSILYFDIASSNTDAVKYLLLTSGNESQVISAKSFDFNVAHGSGAVVTLNDDDRSNVIAMGYEDGTAPSASDVKAFFNIPAGVQYDNFNISVITTGAGGAKIGSIDITPTKVYQAGTLYKVPLANMAFQTLAAPSFDWPGMSMDEIHEIDIVEDEDSPFGMATSYKAAIDILVPGGLAGLVVDIDSDALNNDLGVSRLDLLDPEQKDFFDEIGLSNGIDIQFKKSCVFDITYLVPLINVIGAPGSDHIFNITVTDLAGQSSTQSLSFRVPGGDPEMVYNKNADLWTNTASFKLFGIPDGATVAAQYRIKGAAEWQNATVSGTTATINPEWVDKTAADWTTPNTVLPYSRITAGTGIFANNTYEYKLVVNGSPVDSGEITTAAGDIIPNADMSGWSTIRMPNILGIQSNVPYPNASGNAFWGSGNNGSATGLCTSSTTIYGNASPSAKLKSTSTLGILAAGNLFIGSFSFSGGTGTVSFGQNYPYTARPTALKVKYHAKVGIVNSKSGTRGPLVKDDQDFSRIYVCIVDWASQRKVSSSTSTQSGTWDPEATTNPGEGNVIGYGSFWINQTTDGTSLIEAIIPINYYDKETKPSANYTLVLSAAANAYGDFMNGCSTNELHVDDFEWVY